jgi:hypothetical protein
MKGDASWSQLHRNLETPSQKQNFGNTNPTPTYASSICFGLVRNCVYGEETNQGQISFTKVGNDTQKSARPLNPNVKSYPISGEMVLIFNIPRQFTKMQGTEGPFDSEDGFYFYLSGINIWNNPSFNAVANSKQFQNSNALFHFPLSITNNIFPLISCVGDVILEGRYGNSIRLGNTDRSVPNTWSNDGVNGNPITIIRNGQNPQGLTGGIEDIRDDLSSLYLTSYQKLSQLSLINENFKAYKNPPQTPASYSFPQIVLNSNRIILNAKKDNIFISGEKSVGISSNGTINIESKNGIIMDGIIKLGNTSASEPVLLGNKTATMLRQLITEVRNLADALETNQVFPAGTIAPDGSMISIAGTSVINLNKLLGKLNPNTGNPEILSNKVKVSR